MYPVKKPEADLRLQYRKTLEVGLIIALVLTISIFRLLPDLGSGVEVAKAANVEIKVEDIPPTEQLRDLPPPPPRPSVPVPSENELIPEDMTIESTDLNFDLSELPPPPEQQDEEEGYMFIPYDEPPTPVGGFSAILQNLKYPEIARKSGVEGTVVVGVLIDATGKPLKTQIMKASGTNVGFESAAQDAVLATKWKPAKQRDRAIKVWVSIPVRFQLRNASS